MDKEKYLNRIKYYGKIDQTFESLAGLQKNHLLHIPFENLDIHYPAPIELNLDRIYSKIVLNQRGGFCYELNGLFHWLLTAVGFNTTIISARVFDQDNGFGQEFDHLAIMVKIGEKEYLTDVGFGEFSFEPLEITLGEVQHDQRGDYIIERHVEDFYKVSKLENSHEIPEYIFTVEPRQLNDFQEMCLYHQTNPNSPFTKKRMISKPTINGRITISGDALKVTEGGQVKEEKMESEETFHNLLEKLFNVTINKPVANPTK